jgi:hypothetical protein
LELESAIEYKTWEGLFFHIIGQHTRNQLWGDKKFGTGKDSEVLIQLVGEWVASYGGNPQNIIKDFKNQ